MDIDLVLGVFLTGAAVLVVILLVARSRRIIEDLAKGGPRSARRIVKDSRNEH